MDKNDEEVGKEFERLINEMEKYSVKDGRKLNDEYRKVRDERPVEDDGSMPEHERAAMGGDERRAADTDLYDLGYEDGYHDGKSDMMDELEDKLAEGRNEAVDDGEVDEADYKAYMAERARILYEAGSDGGAGSSDACGGRGGAGGGGLGGRWRSFAGNNPNSSQWLRTVAASLVATTLGILITFGTKSCETDMEVRRANRQLMIDMMYSLDSNIKQFEKDAKTMKEKDSIMQKMYINYMNTEAARITGSKAEKDERPDSVIEKESETFINSMMHYNMNSHDISTEQRFISSENIVKIMKDKKLRTLLNTIYYNETRAIKSIEQINKQTEELMVYMFIDKRKFEVESAREYAQLIMGEERVLKYIVNHHLAYIKVHVCLEFIRQFYKQLLEMTGIKDEDLYEKSMFDSIKIDANYKDSMSIG